MDKDDWFRMLRCAEVDAHDKAAVDHVMLRYRPIAPKPAVAVPPRVGDDTPLFFAKRRKRKYVRVRKRNDNDNGGSRNNGSSSLDLDGVKEIVTLQLLPEHDGEFDLKEESPPSSSGNQKRTMLMEDDNTQSYSSWINLNRSENPTAEIDRKVVESCLTVESVTANTWFTYTVTDDEIMDGLDKDTCPCFVSDGCNRVVWVNDAYKNIVNGDNHTTEFAVRLVVDETTAFWRMFTCKVKLQYTWQESKVTKTMPCDVMKMEFGGFAWRLDVKAALSLGL